jgi:hypothetical protein
LWVTERPDQRLPTAPRSHGGKLLLIVIVATVLVMSLPVVVWLYRQHQYAEGKKVLDAEIARIRAAGDPLTLDELNALYRIPDGETDLTGPYLDAMRGCKYEPNAAGNLPMVGLGAVEVPVPPQVWPQLEQAEQFLAEFSEPLAQLKRLAKQRGAVRYPADLDFRETREEWRLTRNACRLLSLEASCHAHRGNYAEVTDCIMAIGAIADTLGNQPGSVAYLIRSAEWGIARGIVIDFVPDPAFPVTELERLQHFFAGKRWDDGYVPGLVGDRVSAYQAFTLPLRESVKNHDFLPGVEKHQVVADTQRTMLEGTTFATLAERLRQPAEEMWHI